MDCYLILRQNQKLRDSKESLVFGFFCEYGKVVVMKTIYGKGVVDGITKGKIMYYQPATNEVPTQLCKEHQHEWEKFIQGRAMAQEELGALKQAMDEETSKEEVDILEAHMMMMDDVTFEEMVKENIWTHSMNAAYAVSSASKELVEMFNHMENAYMRERALDLKDVTRRIINAILHPQSNLKRGFNPEGEMIILAAKDLLPSETIQMDKTKILALLTEEGTPNSHTVIIARSLNIPAIISVGEQLNSSLDGKEAIVDGDQGRIHIEPDAKTISSFQKRQSMIEKQREEDDELIGLDNVTKDGKRINVYANIGSPEEVEAVCRYDAGGIGLFRSEFLFLEKTDYPTEEEQFQAYKKVAVAMKDKLVIVRTIDIGADKQASYFKIPQEENPAMGYRAIRICLEEPEIFKVQLRALYRASAFGRIAIMFPMITSVEEVLEIKRIIREVKQELTQRGMAYSNNVELGIMIETPAAVMMSDALAEVVDFFSIGTNDLTQYTLAVDRQNPRIERFYNPHHPAVLRMIEFVVNNAHKKGKWVGVCGELGGDLELLEFFLKIGLDEVSIAPAKVLKMRKAIRSIESE